MVVVIYQTVQERRVEINLAIHLSSFSLEKILGTNLNLEDSLDLYNGAQNHSAHNLESV